MNECQECAATALDRAIAEVFRNEVNHLTQSQNLSDAEKVSNVEDALEELGKLGKMQGEMPKYDEWVTPFYVSWYQPRQINLAYSMITAIIAKESIRKQILTDTGRLYVVDFGCGALAMQFGVALAIADALQKNQKVYSACVVSYDKSKAMTNIGKKVWEQFKSEVRKDAKLPYLGQACELIDTRADMPFGRNPQNNEIIWLSAIHAAFSANKDEVKRTLACLTDALRPSAGFITSPNIRSKVAKCVSPFYRNEYKEYSRSIPGIFTGELQETTGARRELLGSLQYPDAISLRFLRNQVTWEWRNVDVHIHTRR